MPEWFSTYAWILPIIAVWDGVWKGIALWKSARNGKMAWFVCLFIFNTVGILPMIYIYGFSKKKTTAS